MNNIFYNLKIKQKILPLFNFGIKSYGLRQFLIFLFFILVGL